MSEQKKLHEIFSQIKSGELTLTEQDVLIDNLTDGGKPDRLINLLLDVENYLEKECKDRKDVSVQSILDNLFEKRDKGIEQVIPDNLEFDFDKSVIERIIISKPTEYQNPIEFYSPPKRIADEANQMLKFLGESNFTNRQVHLDHQLYPMDLMLVFNFALQIVKRYHGVQNNISLSFLMKVMKAFPTASIRPVAITESAPVTNKDSDLQSNNSSYPNPKEVAEQYHIEKGSKHKEYTAEQIAPVMEVTKNYIEENPGLLTIHGHIKKITNKCKGLPGGRDAKSNWIKFYAEKAGLETK